MSVKDLKDALITEQTRTVEIADKAISAVGMIGTLSALVITILSIRLAVLALFGYSRILLSAKIAAEGTASRKFTEHLETGAFQTMMERKILDALQKKWQSTIVIRELQTPDKDDEDVTPFPEKGGPNE